ncbi:hypothetical protein [Streptomyces albireticuli]|uniref:hypothetical protein n=1 Tax=Streptomyces albireticuli TaxID=1940 RepID=UPI001472C0D1|nr:hypothetical protein [Streptomyces albireticuli]MCD9145382.1 hypothetical protein [Streptomyces albireticuli]MCD9165053.1 hypothetical protein [Streptomyces albireticuli]MCD9195356.1 hypothetical protein [Streptomyces albireticuli]
MITGLNTATVRVLDQDTAKAFFTDKFGLEMRAAPAAGRAIPPSRRTTVGRTGGRWKR